MQVSAPKPNYQRLIQLPEIPTMRLYAKDNSDLMEISTIYREDNNLVVEGTIMGAMPIRALVKPGEVRKIFRMMPIGTLLFAASMLFRSSR